MNKNAAIILTFVLALASAQLWALGEAEDYTWTGGGSNNKWNNPNNWTAKKNGNDNDFPQVGDNATIGGGATVIVPSNYPGAFMINDLNLHGTLNIEKTGSITFEGKVEVNGTIKSNGDTDFQDAVILRGDSTFEFSDSDSSFNETIFGSEFNLHIDWGAAKPQFAGSISTSNLMIATTSSDAWLCPTVNAPQGNFIISSQSDVTLDNSSFINVQGLLLRGGTADYTLSHDSNSIETLASDTDGDITVKSGKIITIGSISTIDTANETVTGINCGNLSFLNTSVNLEEGMQIGGNLNIDGGTLNAGSQTMEIAGNMDVTVANAFNAGTGTVRFVQSDSVLEANESDFNNLEVVDSNLKIQNSDFTANGTVKIASSSNPAQLEFVRGEHSAEIANLILEGVAPLVDFSNWNFNISSSLNNEDGEIELTGEQTDQQFAYDSENKRKMGLVRYCRGVGDGTINHRDFWNLKLDTAGQAITLGSNIDIHGYSNPNSDKTLSTPVSESGLIGFHLLAGTTLNTASRTIKLRGSYIKENTAMINGNLRLTLLGDYPAYIGGNNEFFEFICEDASVQGKIIYFQSGKTTVVAAHSDARFAIRGGDTHPPGNQLNLNSLVFPSPRSYVYVLSSQPANQTHYWTFDRTSLSELELEFVYLLHSTASPNPQPRPVNVTFQDCPNWLHPPYIVLSWTKDIGDSATTVHNGRIDKILVDSSVNLNMDFGGIEVEVEGYKVTGFRAHNTNTDQFYIELEEQSYLDTSATPKWKIIRNDSLKDTNGFVLQLYDGGEDSSEAKAYEMPYDDAAPIVGYTLAIADKKQIFVHFSEPVVKSNSSSITKDDFSTTAGGGVSSLKRVSSEMHSGMREVVLTTSGNISAEDILNGVEISTNGLRDIQSSKSTHSFDEGDSVDGTDTLVKNTHRVSDLGLGVVGNGLMEPISARGSMMPVGGSGFGVVTSFAWNDFLPEDDFSIIAHRYTGILEEPRLVYSNSATAKVRNGKLWLPTFGENASLEHNFSGLVPRPHMQTLTKTAVSSNNNNYTYQFGVPNEMLENGKDLEFLFHFANSELYCAQVLDDTASNWYRQVVPWAIRIKDIAVQAGNVSILNNILNPNNGDNTSMYYELRIGGVVTIQVFDLSGDTVAVLQRGFQNAGKHIVSWNGRNGAGNPVARGIYFVRLVGPDKMDQIRKVLVVK